MYVGLVTQISSSDLSLWRNATIKALPATTECALYSFCPAVTPPADLIPEMDF